MSSDKSNKKIPSICCEKCTPYNIYNLKKFKNSKGEDLEVNDCISLCRCGASSNKPFCDGSHIKIGFVGEKEPDRVPDITEDYPGKDITIVYNEGVCSHFGACVNNLPHVFFDTEPWIDPDAESAERIIEIIEKCPSGALSYKIDGKRYQELDQKLAISISKNGPLHVVGGISFKDDMNSKPECKEHYTLCRCGGSKNKPFCDGTHLENGFKDDIN